VFSYDKLEPESKVPNQQPDCQGETDLRYIPRCCRGDT